MGQGVPTEGAYLVIEQKPLFIQPMIESPLPGEAPNVIKKLACLSGRDVRIHYAIISNNKAELYKIIIGKSEILSQKQQSTLEIDSC